jgi:hypothetical protein
MKSLLFIVFAVVSAIPLCAQESVTVKEPAGQCYADLKANLPEAIRWNDSNMNVTSRPLLTTTAGNVEMIAQIVPEHGVDKKTKEQVEVCKIVVGISSREHQTAYNELNSSWLRRNASLMKARVESAMKTRAKKGEQ